jgi:hypothetical protein
MNVEIKISLANGFDIDHAIQSITDALYYSSNVSQYEYNLIDYILTEIKTSTMRKEDISDSRLQAISNAKQVLRDNGYFVDNLWHVDDVKLRYNCNNNEQAQDILDRALTNDATMEQVLFAIDMVAQDENLEL